MNFFCFQKLSLLVYLMNHWSNSTRCTSLNEHFNQIENRKCHMFNFRPTSLDCITYTRTRTLGKCQQSTHGYTVCLNKKETRTNMPISLKLDKHLNNFGYYLLEGYLLFPTVPRNAGSVTSVNKHEHFKDRLTT